jgi:hypothetical protein
MKKEALFVILILVFLINFSSASRLPTVGGDSNSWGSVLNDYLNVSLNDTGQLRSDAILNFTTNRRWDKRLLLHLGEL